MTRHELNKMTVIKLRELALQYPDMVGVHGMKKSELVDALAKLMELPEEEKQHKKVKIKKEVTKQGLKKAIHSLKDKRAEAIESKDHTQLKKVRNEMKKAKRQIRKLAIA